MAPRTKLGLMLVLGCASAMAPPRPARASLAAPGLSAPRGALTNQKALADRVLPRTWVPLASTFELDPERPTPVRFLEQRYVAWRDNSGEWRVMDDACAHRLAPLSEGRVNRETDKSMFEGLELPTPGLSHSP